MATYPRADYRRLGALAIGRFTWASCGRDPTFRLMATNPRPDQAAPLCLAREAGYSLAPASAHRRVSSASSWGEARMQDAVCMRGRVVVGLSSMLAYRFGRLILDIPMAAHRSAVMSHPGAQPSI